MATQSRSTAPRIAPLVLFVLLICAASAEARRATPVPVSPASRGEASAFAPCPTFLWGGLEGAVAYEIVVYRTSEDGSEAAEVFGTRIEGSATGWAPPLDRCLRPGESYAWSIRAQTEEGLSEWSEPALFEVAPAPDADEVAAAIRVLRRHLTAVQGGSSAPPEIDSSAGGGEGEREGEGEGEGESPLRSVRDAAADLSPSVPARMRVDGEVRTVDPAGEPRLWGRGRPGAEVFGKDLFGLSVPCTNGGVRFGLSSTAVDWGSAADACPAGSWVCRESALVACQTERPDGIIDALACDGSEIDYPAITHWGWVADDPGSRHEGVSYSELGVVGWKGSCESLPVWCCWEE